MLTLMQFQPKMRLGLVKFFRYHKRGWTLRIKLNYINIDKLQHIARNDLFDPALNILLTCYLINKYKYTFRWSS